jgi:hypothetical protein
MAVLIRLRPLAAELNLPADWLRDAAISGIIPRLPVERMLLFRRPAVEDALIALATDGLGASREVPLTREREAEATSTSHC